MNYTPPEKRPPTADPPDQLSQKEYNDVAERVRDAMRNKAFIEANKKIADEAEKHSDVTEFLQRTGYTPDEGEVSRGVMQSLQTLQDFNKDLGLIQGAPLPPAPDGRVTFMGQDYMVPIGAEPSREQLSPAERLQQRRQSLDMELQKRGELGFGWAPNDPMQERFDKSREFFDRAMSGTDPELGRRGIHQRVLIASEALQRMEDAVQSQKKLPNAMDRLKKQMVVLPDGSKFIEEEEGRFSPLHPASKNADLEHQIAREKNALEAQKLQNEAQREATQNVVDREERQRDRRLKYDDLEIKKRDGEIKALLDAQKQQGSPAIQQGAQAILQQPAGQFERAAAEAQQALSAMEQQRAQTAATMQQAAQTYSAVPKAAEAFQILRDVSDSGLEPTQLLPEQQKAYAASQIYVDRLMQYNPIPVSADITEEQLKAFEPGTLVLTPDGAIRTIKHQD